MELDGIVTVETDHDGDTLVTFVYPELSTADRAYLLSLLPAALAAAKGSDAAAANESEGVVGRTGGGSFVYMKTQAVPCLEHTSSGDPLNEDAEDDLEREPAKKNPAFLTMVVLTRDFLPPKYMSLAGHLCEKFISSRSGVNIVEAAIQLSVKGRLGKEWDGRAFSSDEYKHTDISYEALASKFEMNFVLVFSAMLLRKRVAVVASNHEELFRLLRTVTALVPTANAADAMFPMITSEIKHVLKEQPHFVAGFLDAALVPRGSVDILVDAVASEISILNNDDQFTLGKFHKDVATSFIQMVDAGSTAADIAKMLEEMLDTLSQVVSLCKDSNGAFSQELLQGQKMSRAMKKFCYNYALASGIPEAS